jgi:hypothetical protein
MGQRPDDDIDTGCSARPGEKTALEQVLSHSSGLLIRELVVRGVVHAAVGA